MNWKLKNYLFPKKYLLGLFIVQILALNLPIIQREMTIASGELHSFQTVPIDPRDLFRGRYVILNFKENEREFDFSCQNSDYFERQKEKIYVEVVKNGEFSELKNISHRPEFAQYLTIKDYYCYNNKLTLRLPFERYYANEYEAPKLEQEVRNAKLNVWINKGNYAIKDLEPLPEIKSE